MLCLDRLLHSFCLDRLLHSFYLDRFLHSFCLDRFLHSFYLDRLLHSFCLARLLHSFCLCLYLNIIPSSWLQENFSSQFEEDSKNISRHHEKKAVVLLYLTGTCSRTWRDGRRCPQRFCLTTQKVGQFISGEFTRKEKWLHFWWDSNRDLQQPRLYRRCWLPTGLSSVLVIVRKYLYNCYC